MPETKSKPQLPLGFFFFYTALMTTTPEGFVV